MKTIGREEFLKRLYEYCEGELELRALPSRKRKFFDLQAFKGIDAFCEAHTQENVYFAVATRNGGGTKEHIQHIPASFNDIDWKNTPRNEARKKIQSLGALGLWPTFIIQSGGGYQPYWKFKEPLGKKHIEDVEALNRTLAHALGGDFNACDASRILRVPGTKNFKYDPPREVKIVFHENAEYDLSDFDCLPDDSASASSNEHYIDSTHTYYKERNKGVTNLQDKDSGNKRNISFSEGHRDHTLFHLANYLVKGGMPPQEIEIYLKFIAQKCTPPFPEKEIQSKLKSALKRSERAKTALTAEIRDWVSVTKGWFSVTNAQHDVTSVTQKGRAKVRVILGRLVKEGILERHHAQDGIFRRIENETEELDFIHASDDVLDFRWPCGIQNLVEIMPGNLVAVAGEVEAGKTAFLFNTIKFNMHRFDMHYFTSEMGASEMKKRLKKFDDVVLTDWKFTPHPRSGDFHDVIVPDAVNVIDFLEIHDEFYKVGGLLKRIHDKLNEGIAIVAIQKPKGRDEGLGGQRSMEVARLYVSLSKEYPGGRLKISKGKNWRTDRNPDGLSTKYKIISGAQMIQVGDWARI
jgi:hypothetical protein